MEEKRIIKSKVANVKLIRNIIWIIGLLSGIGASMWYAESRRFSYEEFSSYSYTYSTSNYIGEMFSMYGVLSFLGVVAAFFLIGYIFYKATSKVSLTITDKRVCGTAVFGKRVDLPLDSISAIGVGVFKKITVSTPSGVISFPMIENRDEIHKALSDLLIARQEKPASTTTIKQEIPQSNADELKKYKALLDSGVISQAEFDAKKKQLLGL